jgi:hypothetical protein
MANPNTVLRYMPKRPYDFVAEYLEKSKADQQWADLRVAGLDAKVTTVRQKWRGVNRVAYRVWSRAKV